MTIAERLRSGAPGLAAALAERPLVIDPDNLVERPWGGRRLLALKRLDARPGCYGESFELAAEPDDHEAAAHPSTIVFEDGSRMPLPELLALAGAELLGEAFVRDHGPRIPLLPKLLDVAGLLSIQAHPPGHPELYVVVDAEPGARLRLGWREDVDPIALAARLERGRALHATIAEFVALDDETLAERFAALLARRATRDELLALLGPHLRRPTDAERLHAALDEALTIHRELVDRMHELELAPGDVIYNACPPDPISATIGSAEIHALGDDLGRAALVFEVRRPGVTYRAWDHLRLPPRPLDVLRALASVSPHAGPAERFRVTPTPSRDQVGVARLVANPAFVVDRLQPTPELDVELRSLDLPATLHALRGEVELVDAIDRRVIDRMHAGASRLLPVGHAPLLVRARPEAGPCELLHVIVPLGPGLPHELEPHVAAKRNNWADRGRVVAASLGPRDVIAIVNGGDGPTIAEHLAAHATSIFRADASTRIHVHEETRRRGQLLGLLDALREHPLDPDRVALGIMLPGKGTRLSPFTQRLRGIKPLLPVPIRTHAAAPWLDAATASLASWVSVTWTLERLGFRGIAWKWGDEPQIPAQALARLSLDLREVDALRFGARVVVDDDLARNKEWLAVEPAAREGLLLRTQVRRRSLADLRERLGARDDAPLVAHVHVGSPAVSHRFVAAATQAFGDCDEWLDVDGYLFEALTHDADAWARECARDAGLRALLERVPDFYARARALRSQLEHERGHPLRIAVIDFGEDLHWCDVGQLGKAREAFAVLARDDEPAEFARVLAALDHVEPDRWGNRVAGRSAIPDDGSVRECVLVDATIGSGPARRAVVLRSTIGHAQLEPGSVALDCDVDQLALGRDAFAFGSTIDHLQVPACWVHTSIPSDPSDPSSPLESWWADAREDPGAPERYEQAVWGNPTSFAAKFAQVRQR